MKVGRLPLNVHAKDKLLRLVGERYNPENDVLTIMTDRCPLRQQNLDYALYLLTALFHESWVSDSHLFYLTQYASSAIYAFSVSFLHCHLLQVRFQMLTVVPMKITCTQTYTVSHLVRQEWSFFVCVSYRQFSLIHCLVAGL